MVHGHGDPYKVPDYKIYKVEDVPLLLKTQKALEAQGLCDPWLRNEVWRYNVKQFGNEKIRLKGAFGIGFKYGLAAAVITAGGTYLYDMAFPPDHHHENCIDQQ